MQVPLSTLHPTRYFLQSLPFLFPSLGLVASRIWQVLLWVGLTGAAAIALAWRTLPSEEDQNPRSTRSFKVFLRDLRALRGQTGLRFLFAGWLFLFLLRVGVYYHLEIMLIVPLLFVSAKHPWRSLAAVVFASIWAGFSRVNWFPVPAMLAIAIYFLENPINHKATKTQSQKEKLRAFVSSWLTYLKLPFTWATVGLLSALAAQAIYIPLSGNAGNAEAFTSSFSSVLLWNRLWPNETYPLGVLAAILIVSGPLLIVLFSSRLSQLHPVRRLGLLSMLAVLFIGGLVVSVKIGGGGDLHNMDAYAVFVSLLALYFIGGKVQGESDAPPPLHPPIFAQPNTVVVENESGRKWGERGGPWHITAIALLIPLIFLIASLSPFPKLNEKADQEAFKQLKTLVEQAKGPVLFINERHLVTFHNVNVALVPEYEAVTLMEMAMSNNQAYLQQFYADLKIHRFAAIVSGKQNVGVKDESDSFADESNVWNTRVSPYILCYYEPLTEIDTNESKIEFYTPRTTPGVCP
jgi:hypothetical protein